MRPRQPSKLAALSSEGSSLLANNLAPLNVVGLLQETAVVKEHRLQFFSGFKYEK